MSKNRDNDVNKKKYALNKISKFKSRSKYRNSETFDIQRENG